MEFKHIEYFIETCGHKSISQAAEALFISQQALSKCIANLEEELGCALFTRTVKGSTLTEEGRYVYEQFNPLVQSFRGTVSRTVAHLEHRPRKVTFACAPLIFGVLDAELPLTFQETHPEILLERLETSDRDVDEWVAADETHFGLLAIPEDRHGQRFDFIPVKTLPLMLYVHKDHPLARMERVEFGMLRDENFLTMEARSHYHSMIEEKAKQCGFKPRKTFASGDVTQVFSLVNSGEGVFLATENPATAVLFPNVVPVPLADWTLNYSIAFIFQDHEKLDAPSRRFIEFIVEQAKKQAEARHGAF